MGSFEVHLGLDSRITKATLVAHSGDSFTEVVEMGVDSSGEDVGISAGCVLWRSGSVEAEYHV